MTATVVVPAYNEAARIDPGQFLRLAAGVGRILFVDDAFRVHEAVSRWIGQEYFIDMTRDLKPSS